MKAYLRTIALGLLTAGLTLAAGCQQVPPPAPATTHHARSLATAPSDAQPPEHVIPWYADRNDRHPAVTTHQAVQRHEQAHIRTVDRQRSIHGRAFDSFHRTTRRHFYIEQR